MKAKGQRLMFLGGNAPLPFASLTFEGKLHSIAGGGDTLAALKTAKSLNGFSYVSTAGGAFLEWLEGRDLPGVVALGG